MSTSNGKKWVLTSLELLIKLLRTHPKISKGANLELLRELVRAYPRFRRAHSKALTECRKKSQMCLISSHLSNISTLTINYIFKNILIFLYFFECR